MARKDPEKRLKEIEQEFVKVAIIDTPGTVMVGLGLYEKFGSEGEALLPFLNDPNNVNIMIMVGAAIMVWGVSRIIALSRERVRLQRKIGV